MFEKIIEMSMLFDFYGQLLTEKQQEILQLYYEDNNTLAEIAENLGISRQAVHDTVHKAEKSLHEYEESLGLIRKFLENKKAIDGIEASLNKMIGDYQADEALVHELERMKTIIATIND
jgi:uncharacterized protein